MFLIIGSIPVVPGKLEEHNLKIMVDEDPTMRRPNIVMEANPQRSAENIFTDAI